MANHDQPDGNVAPAAAEAAAHDPLLSSKGAARRRFTRNAAGIGSGVILTLVSQPGMADVVCAKPSLDQSLAPNGGKWSAVASHVNERASSCRGLSPAAWAAMVKWPTVSQPNSNCIPTFECGTTAYGKAKMGDLLLGKETCDVGNSCVGAYLIATYLNVASDRVPVMNIDEVKKMWKSAILYGYYKPTPDVTWSIPRLVEYLKTTMTA